MNNLFGEHKKDKIKHLFVIGCILLFLCAAISTFGEAIDLLRIPSEKVDWAPYSILMDVVRVDNRIVVVGERGHILYSDDECSSWIQAEVPVSVALTAVYFPTVDQGWAVGHAGVVLHTEDGGKTWKKQLDGTQINKLVYDQIKQMVKAKNDLLADKDAGLTKEEREDMELEAENLTYFLIDAEFILKQGPSNPLMDLWFKNDQEGIIIGCFGIFLSTKDGGNTWQPNLDRIDNTNGFHYYGITRSGDDLFIAGEAGGLYRSEDFGQSWQRLASPYEGTLFGIIGDPSGGFVTTFGLQGHIYYSLDRGEAWTPSKTGRGASLSGGAFLSDGSFCVVGVDGVILRSKDRGKTISVLPERYPGMGIAIVELKRDVLAVVGTGGFSRIEINNSSSKK